MAVTLGVRTFEGSPPAVAVSSGGSSPWLKYAFILTPVVLFLATLVSFASRNLREANAEMKAEMSAGDSDRARLEGVGLASKNGSAGMAEKEFQKIIGAAKLTAKQIINTAELEADALMYTARQKTIVQRRIADNFSRELYGRNPQMAALSFDIGRLRVEIAHDVELLGDMDSLQVDHFWSAKERQRVRPEKMRRLVQLQLRLLEVEESGIREGASAIRSMQGRG